MGKSKLAQAAKPSKGAEVKHLSSVKSGAVTKPSQTSKSKSKELAKQVATKSEKVGKKSKKAVKEPTPELSSDSESVDDSDEAMSSASGADSDDESDEVIDTPAVKANGVASNGVAKAADAETSDSSESSDSDADEAPVVPKAAAKGMNVATKSDQDSSDSSVEDSGDESDVESEADSSDDDKADAKPGAIDSKELNGKLAKIASKEGSSAESDDEDSSDAASEADSSDSDDSSEDEEEVAPPSKKRKADAEPAPAAKKAKADAMASSFDDASKGNLFIGNLSWNVDEEWLSREFEQFGELKSVRIVTDRETGRSRGFGYVEFVNPSHGVKAHKDMKGAEIDGRALNVDFAESKKDKPAAGGFKERANKYGDQVNEPSSTIFCANLAFEASEDDISNAFGELAPIKAVRIPTDMNTGQAKGIAYVQFNSVEDATTAFEGMSGAVIAGRPIRVDYATDKPRNSDGGRGGGDRGGRGRGRGGFDRGGRGGGRGRGGFDRGGRGGGRGGSTNRGGFGDFKGKKMTF
ncbi:MAG: hypothetical protein LQ346_004335 [Caloplaca aetnensis]|nr:MAG: hypothetical protein LQ346_004335 [Caloplaca aetnensis]